MPPLSQLLQGPKPGCLQHGPLPVPRQLWGAGGSGPCWTRPKAPAPCKGHLHCSRAVPEGLGEPRGLWASVAPSAHRPARRALLTQRDSQSTACWPAGDRRTAPCRFAGDRPVPHSHCPLLRQGPWHLPGLTLAMGAHVRTALSGLGRGPHVTARADGLSLAQLCGAGLGCSRGRTHPGSPRHDARRVAAPGAGLPSTQSCTVGCQ